MTDLQKVVYHDGDCSCYTSIVDVDGQVHDCNICDCGELRKKIRSPSLMYDNYSPYHLDVLLKCWENHLKAINNQR